MPIYYYVVEASEDVVKSLCLRVYFGHVINDVDCVDDACFCAGAGVKSCVFVADDYES